MLSGIGLFILAVVVFLVGFQVIHFGKIYPGVTVAGVDLGGMPRPQVENILAQQFPYHTQGKITITFKDPEVMQKAEIVIHETIDGRFADASRGEPDKEDAIRKTRQILELVDIAHEEVGSHR